MKLIFRSTLIFVFLLYSITGYANDATVEVLHSWEDSGDINALEILKADMSSDGYGWQNTNKFDLDNFDELNSRVFNGDAPAAVEITDLDYKQWGRLGFLANLNAVAATENWNRLIPEEVAAASKYNGNFVSVPVSVHRTNWLWINKSVLARFNLRTPTNWKEFDTVSEYLLQRNYPVLAIEHNEKSNALLFESLVLSIGGADLYRNAFINHDIASYKTSEFKAAITRFYKLHRLAERSRSLSQSATFDFIESDSAFVFGGDWMSKAVGNDGKEFMSHYTCSNMPGIKNQFVFSTDGFVFFNLPNIHEKVLAQTALAGKLMSPTFQKTLNQNRGSIPARTDLPMNGTDRCAQKAYSDISNAARSNTLVPSAANGAATSASVSHNFVLITNELAESPRPIDESAKLISRKIRLGNYLMSQ